MTDNPSSLTELFAKTDIEIVINEAYDAIVDAIELLLEEQRSVPYYLLANRQYIECIDHLYNTPFKTPNINPNMYYLKILSGLRYLYEYNTREKNVSSS